ncbi:kazal-type serine protease inhibitor domain-containing protein 1 isoform X1 [Xenopus laevis]|uniref:Kazal-type serine protease inhibitor domain-containing protein 1 isoform X1 n=3 Tax=Xenopus laevis TaxID=8355 RepID=A0A8J0TZJ3_XENLA|nr:kazal-type serine protease inhibitor domain-containing protein 1 isoform X1 [Xenopus laevis]
MFGSRALLTFFLCLHSIGQARRLPWKGWAKHIEGKCPQCQEERCPPVPQWCPSGRVLDACGCCWECANVEGQLCDMAWQGHTFGACGEGLRCQLRGGHHVNEPQCVCSSQESVCGTDRRTYRNVCRMQEAARTRRRAQLTLAHVGPCKEAPALLTAPQETVALVGQRVILGCEVTAQPLAELEWRKEGTEGALPGKSSHIIVQTRGGPHRTQVTGWLQIHQVREEDVGLYMCHAWNAFGEVTALARLKVISPADSAQAPEVNGELDVTDDEDAYEQSREGPSGSHE